MNMKFKVIFILIGLSMLSAAGRVSAQTTGELENVEIEIVRERKLSLPEAERRFSKIAPHASEPISPPITYSFKPLELKLPLANLAVRPLKLKKESETETRGGHFSAGYGNFASPYLEGYYTTKRNPKQSLGVHALLDVASRGPVDKTNSGNGVYGISLFGTTYGTLKTDAHLSFNRTFTHFYGYPAGTVTESDNIRQHFDRFSMGASLANGTKGKLSYDLDAGFGYLQDRFEAKESNVEFNFSSAYEVDKSRQLRTNASYQLLSRQDVAVEAKPRSLFQMNMLYTLHPIEKLTLDAGFGFALENDTIDKDFHLYPKLFAHYQIAKRVSAKASLTGQIQAVSLHSLSDENPWLAPNVLINHTNEAFVLTSAIEAGIGKNIKTEVGGSIASLHNLYFYKNDPANAARFNLQYDKGATERINFYGAVDHAVSKRSYVSIRADWFGYVTDTLAAAWHRPTYKVTLLGNYNFFQKLKLTGSFTMLGGMKAYDFATSEGITLDPALDLKLRADYMLSEKFLVFVQGANLLASDYQLYLNYPARGPHIRLGFSWSF